MVNRMARYIDADEFKKWLLEYSITDREREESKQIGFWLDEFSTADVRENIHGKWIEDIKRFGEDNYHCSVCGAVLEEDDVKWRNNYFCYHCGAKMRKVGDAE